MQLFALDENQRLIFARDADKGDTYFCLECGDAVRARSGPQRQPHFYHLSLSPSCRQNGKSFEHLAVQMHLQELLPPGEAVMERRFEGISRIADVVWEPQKLIFEVQCSPITAAEVRARNKDYRKAGYEVVWILHDMRYNQRRLSAAESWLQGAAHYYTDMNARGEGIIYDQLAVVREGLRVERMEPLGIEVRAPMREKPGTANLPEILRRRAERWRVCFAGDYLISAARDEVICLKVKELEGKWAESERGWMVWELYVVRPYRAFLYLMLEGLAR